MPAKAPKRSYLLGFRVTRNHRTLINITIFKIQPIVFQFYRALAGYAESLICNFQLSYFIWRRPVSKNVRCVKAAKFFIVEMYHSFLNLFTIIMCYIFVYCWDEHEIHRKFLKKYKNIRQILINRVWDTGGDSDCRQCPRPLQTMWYIFPAFPWFSVFFVAKRQRLLQ